MHGGFCCVLLGLMFWGCCRCYLQLKSSVSNPFCRVILDLKPSLFAALDGSP